MATFPKTPRPMPVISDELTFSRKKRRTAEQDFILPKSPIKSAPPISRIFRHRKSSTPGAHPISFRHTSTQQSESRFESPYYTNRNQLYFDQCFTSLSRLGAGSFGEVIKVQSKEDGKLYAVKKSRQQFRGDYDRRQQLEEVNKNELLQGHPNCVQFYKAWEERQYLYIQTELCEMSLKDYVEQVQHIEESEIWKMIVDLSFGLKHIHDSHFAHMDIKPANLFLGRDGHYKIGDFGLVVELTRDIGDALEGDPKYMAPELMEGKFSKAADIFSLGITILELACTLDLPRGGPLWQQLRHGKLPMEFTQGLSDDLILLIQQMMDPNPYSRPTIDAILAMPSVVRAQREQESLLWFGYILILLWAMVITIFKFIRRIFLAPIRYFQSCGKETPYKTTPPILQETHSYYPPSPDSSFNGHESILCSSQLDKSIRTPSPARAALFTSKSFGSTPNAEGPQELRSPLRKCYSPPSSIQRSSPNLLKPVSKSVDRFPPMDNYLHLDNLTPPNRFTCRTSPHARASPQFTVSERLLRSRLFNEPEVPATPSTPKNLMESFNDVSE